MNFKKRVNGSWTDASHYIHNTSTDTITTLPAVLYPTGTTATVGLKGQTLQSSIPSPTSPIMPQGTGERTGNLFDYQTMASGVTGYYLTSTGVETASNAWAITDYIPCNGQSFTLGKIGGNSPSICLYDSDKTFIAGQAYNTGGATYKNDITVTASQNAKYIRFSYFKDNQPDDLSTIMLNEGTTALPHELYGYKIPISSASTTTPVYLGELQTTRKIKKIKASDITWIDGSATGYNFYRGTFTIPKLAGGGISTLLSNKYRSVDTRNNLLDGDIAPYNLTTVETIVIRDDRYSSAADWLSANGDTEIWYVLATPETAVVNEPLMKVGNYADSLSTTIPVTAGENTLDVQTTVAPSEVSAGFSGWHPVSSAHERSGGAWD